MKRRNFLRATGVFPFFTGEFIQALSKNGKEETDAVSLQPIPAPAAERPFFYKPENAWAADFIPFFAEGKFQLFYLLDWRDVEKYGEGTPWYRLSTTDFVHFTEHGEVIPRGSKEEQDLYIFTGCAIKGPDQQYHIFYTGHNHHLAEKDKPMQGVMHAVSPDLQHWKKIPEHVFFAPAKGYEKHDWRDPFVFFNEETGEYNMLLAARFTEGISRRRGLTALCSSKDLIKWEVKQPFYAPNQYFTHECPDLFRIGDWWYLVFSEFTEQVATRYRMSRSLKGPWLTPVQDTFDGHAFYAAKTASDGRHRYIFGWNPTRSENKDNGGWNWGGNLVVHQLKQEADGRLTVQVPASVPAAFSQPVVPEFRNAAGKMIGSKQVDLKAAGRFEVVSGGKMPATCRIKTTVQFKQGTRDFGVSLRCSDDFEKSYYIRLEPSRSRLVFDMWPRPVNEVYQQVELERMIALPATTPVTIELFMDGTMGVVYVNNTVAMNFRAYDLKEGNWGFFVNDGEARFSAVEISVLPSV